MKRILNLFVRGLLIILLTVCTLLNLLILHDSNGYALWAVYVTQVVVLTLHLYGIVSLLWAKKETRYTPMAYDSDMTIFVDADSNDMPKVMSSNRLPTGEYCAWLKKR